MAATWGQYQVIPAMALLCRKHNEQGDDVGPQDFSGLSATNLGLIIHPVGGTAITGDGVFQIINASQGILAYQPVIADFATPGPTLVTVTINLPGYNPSTPLLITVVPA